MWAYWSAAAEQCAQLLSEQAAGDTVQVEVDGVVDEYQQQADRPVVDNDEYL